MLHKLRTALASGVALALAPIVFMTSAHAQRIPQDSAMSIEELLKSGWEVAGFASNCDTRSTFILFKNPKENYLVQCLAGYDVTREPRIFRNCYRLQ
jgi:hypothetical protein